MALRRAAVGTATAGLVTALTALVLSTLPALAHEGEEEGEGKDAIGEVDPDYPTKAIRGDASGPGASCVDGQAGYFQLEAMVYDRAGLPCRVCGTPVKSIRQGQRATYFCPNCQKS